VMAAFGIAQHDQVALRFEQAAGAFCAPFNSQLRSASVSYAARSCAVFLCRKRSRMLSMASPAQAIANRKLRLIAKALGRSRIFRSAAGDEPICAAEGGGEIMNERTERMIQGCRRENRRMCNLIEESAPSPIAGHPGRSHPRLFGAAGIGRLPRA